MAHSASAQAVYGSILGTVTDNTGAVVQNADITVTDLAKGTLVKAQTNDSGQYTVQHLIPDTYKVEATAPGFSKTTVDNILVYADTAPKADIQLSIGHVSNSVTVTSASPLLETDRADVSTVLNDRALVNFPNLNRNFTAFELLTPGTSYTGWSLGEAENPQRSQQIAVDGQLPFATGYELDGTDNQDPILGVAVINPNLDAVSEMKVTPQNYDAEFRGAVAGLVTAQTKSGSSQLHGSAFEFRRSDAQQARDPFAEATRSPVTGRFIAPNLHNQFGGSIGGQILKQELFFFGDYQGLCEKTGTALLTTVPTDLARTTCTSGGDCNLSEYLGIVQIYDPASNETSVTGRNPFKGNIIPAGRLSPPAVNFFKLIPAPNIEGAGIVNNFSASGFGIFNTDQYDVRIDSQTKEKLHLFGRYTHFGSNLSGAPFFGAAGGPGFGSGGFAGTDVSSDHSIAVGGDYVLSAKRLIDFRFGYYRIHVDLKGPDFNQPLGNQLGIPNANVGDLALNGGLPQFSIEDLYGGLYGTTAGPFLQKTSQYQLVNNWSYLMGRHNIRFGADIRYAKNHLVGLATNNLGDNNNLRSGVYHFDPARTGGPDSFGLGYATFLLGDTTSFQRSQTQNTNAQERQKRLFFYIQDQWRATSKFTLNYGLRWEMYFPETVNGKGQGGLLDLNTGVIRIAGYGKWGTNLNVSKNWITFAPRVGFAYQPTPTTVVRAGYGRAYGQGWRGDTFGQVLTFTYPTQVSQNLNPESNVAAVFNLTQGPPLLTFPTIPADGNFSLPNGISVPTRPLTMRLPTLDAWNLTVQQELTRTVALQAAYVGSHGYHNMFDSNNQFDVNLQTIAGFNQINPDTGRIYTQSERRPYFNGTAQKLGVKYGHPFGWEQSVRFNANLATSSYHALQIKLEQRFRQGLQFLAHYTWSRAMTHDHYYFLIDPRVAYGPSYYNHRNVFVFAGTYELPLGQGKTFAGNAHGWVNQTIGGFILNGSVTAQSGLPFNIGYANCGQDQDLGICYLSKTGVGFNLHKGSYDPISRSVPYLTPSPYVLQPAGQLHSTFGPYARPASGAFGNIGRSQLVGPGSFNTDLAVAKNFNLTERLIFQLRAEAFNAFNQVNLGQPDGCVDCQDGFAGRIFSTVSSQDGTSMRRLQFAARFQF